MTERGHSENLGIDGRVILKILNKQVWHGRLHSTLYGDGWWTLADKVLDLLVPQNTRNLVSWIIINTFTQFCCMQLRVLWGILYGVKLASYSRAPKIVLFWRTMRISYWNCNNNPSHTNLKLCTSMMGIPYLLTPWNRVIFEKLTSFRS
jgi:hypothetical protein